MSECGTPTCTRGKCITCPARSLRATAARPKRRAPITSRTHPLDDARGFLDNILYATPEQKNAIALTYAVSHGVDAFTTVPRLLATSKEPQSGKTTVLDAARYLCQNPWASNPTTFALRAKYNEPDRPTPIHDEISKIFGEGGMRGRGSPLYQILVEGYRRSATLSLSVDRTTQDVSCYGVAVLAGLKTAAPPDLRSRSIIIQMKAMPDTLELEDSLDPGVEARGLACGEKLHAWVTSVQDELAEHVRGIRKLHPKLRARRAQIWGPLAAIALEAGGEWPERFLRAFTAIGLDASDKPKLSSEEQMLMDAAAHLYSREDDDNPYLTSAELLRALRLLDSKVYQAQSDRQMAMMMARALGSARVLTLPSRKTAKGWSAKAVLAAATALERSLMAGDEEEAEPDEYDSFFDEDEDKMEVAS